MYQLYDMKYILQPDVITKAACGWLLSGAVPGAYRGPDPGLTHDLSPLLSREMNRRDLELSAAAQWFRREQILRPVLERISEEGLAVWAMKGFDLAGSVYPFPGGRTMCDADLFIEKRSQRRILKVFDRSGWTRGSPGDGVFTAGIVSEMKMYRLGAMAELHTHIFYFPATFPGKLPYDLFENGRSLEPSLMGFAWHNALLMVLLHMITNSVVRPVWWLDVSLLCGKVTESGTWIEFARNAHLSRLGGAIAYLLSIASGALGAPVPDKVTDVLKRSSGSREDIATRLRIGKKLPTLLNLKHLTGWKRISWFYALIWLVLTGQHPLRRTRT